MLGKGSRLRVHVVRAGADGQASWRVQKKAKSSRVFPQSRRGISTLGMQKRLC